MKKIQVTKNLLKLISDHLFLAFTDQQIAFIAGISERTYARIKASNDWQKIKKAEFGREAIMRQKVWNGDSGWQGAAWMLERKYASQLAKPEVQLSINASTNTTNNTIVISAEQAAGLKSRSAAVEAELLQLTPPSTRNARKTADDIISQVIDKPSTSPIESGTLDSSVSGAASEAIETTPDQNQPGHPTTRTPARSSLKTTPALSGKFRNSERSSNSKEKAAKKKVMRGQRLEEQGKGLGKGRGPGKAAR